MTAIRQDIAAEELKSFFEGGFERHAVAMTGVENGVGAPQTFIVRDDAGGIAAAVIARIFWGQLHIKNVLSAEHARGKGFAVQLMDEAHAWGRTQGCDFAFVETMSFQAEGFYKKLGYVTEFARPGYAAGTSFIYMKKDLKDTAYA